MAPLAERSLLLDAEAVGAAVVAVGERGHVLLSRDGGKHWMQAQAPTRAMLCAVEVVGEEHIWAVGHDATILCSTDGGRTWVSQFQAPEEEAPLLDVWFASTRRGLAVGAYGLFLVTADGGEHWNRQTITEDDPHFYCLAEGPEGDLYLAGEFGTVLRSLDRGRTWYRLLTPYHGSLFGILPLPDGSVLVYGLRGNVYRSEDKGESWERIDTGTTASLLGGVRAGDGSVLLVGLSGTILVSGDNGRSFTSANRPDRRGVAAIVDLQSEGLLLLGEGGAARIDPLGRS
jgi:photosystem II stability/assembly factor-like uncharacterized protein